MADAQHLPHFILGPEWTTTVPIPEPDVCLCNIAEGTWQMTVEEGHVQLTHSVCGKPLMSDLMQSVVMDIPLTVTITPEKEICCCPESCDCDYWLTLKGASS